MVDVRAQLRMIRRDGGLGTAHRTQATRRHGNGFHWQEPTPR